MVSDRGGTLLLLQDVEIHMLSDAQPVMEFEASMSRKDPAMMLRSGSRVLALFLSGVLVLCQPPSAMAQQTAQVEREVDPVRAAEVAADLERFYHSESAPDAARESRIREWAFDAEVFLRGKGPDPGPAPN